MESTLQLQDLFENASDLIQSISIGSSLENSRVLYVNRSWCEVLGYSPEEATQLSLEDLLHPDSWEHCQALIYQLHGGQVQQLDQMEMTLVTRSGRAVVLQGNINVRYQQGKPVATRGIFRDITEQSHSSKALKAAKEQFELVVRASQDGFWDWNLVSNEIYYSPRWKEMLGYADDELPNSLDTWKSLMHPEDLEKALRLLEAYNEGIMDHFEMFQRFQHKNGSIVYTFSRVLHLKDETGQVIRMVGSYSDMSETMKMQQALQASELRLTGVLDSSLDGIMALRSVRGKAGEIEDFRWILANPAACQLLGCRPGSLDHKSFWAELLDHPKGGPFSLYRQVVETGQPLQREFCDEDRHKTWLHIAVKMGDGCVVTFRDVTTVRNAELALQQANTQLEQQVAELNQRNGEMALLSDLSDFLQACLSLTEACQIITDLMPDLFPQCQGVIYSMNAAEGLVEPLAHWGGDNMVPSLFHPQDCWALRRGRFHASGTSPHPTPPRPSTTLPPESLSFGLSSRLSSVLSSSPVRSPRSGHPDRRRRGMLCNHILQTHPTLPQESCCIPMIAQGDTIGLLYLSSADSGLLTEGKQQLAQTVAEQIALAIANLRLRGTLEDQSIRDPLTQLYNRRHLKKFLTQTLHRAQHLGNPVGVIMMDVDHFKHFNDDFGHEAGDLVLQQVAQVLLDNIRVGDIACRYGGEELTLVLPQATLAATTAKAEVLCRAVRNLKVQYQGQSLRSVTISAGVACYPNHGESAITLLQLADLALYRAKAQGRDQVQVALGGDGHPATIAGEGPEIGRLPPYSVDSPEFEDED
ncbi:MAG: diguanylate cyclase [Prochlorothrix sp.]